MGAVYAKVKMAPERTIHSFLWSDLRLPNQLLIMLKSTFFFFLFSKPTFINYDLRALIISHRLLFWGGSKKQLV